MLRRILFTFVAFVAVLAGGIWLGGHPDRLPEPVRGALVSDDTAAIGEALGVLERRYYRKVDDTKVRDAALRAAIESLGDQYSAYLSPSDLNHFRDVTESRFDGVGVEVGGVAAGLRITKVYDGSPAKGAGLRTGDVIVRAGDRDLRGLSATAASSLVRGPDGSKVTLGVRRSDDTFTRTFTRARIRIPAVESTYDAEKEVGVVRLASFSEGAHGELQLAIERLQRRGARGLVLDLRGNPGGLVSEAQRVSSLFLDGGPIVTTKGRSVRSRTLDASADPPFPRLPLVVLVDRNSASAAEIVTGALQDRGRAKVYGTRTYGKGVFQEVIDLGSGGALDITVGQYYTPKGRNLGGAGVSRGENVGRGQGIAPDAPATDDPKTTRVDEAEQTAIAAAAR